LCPGQYPVAGRTEPGNEASFESCSIGAVIEDPPAEAHRPELLAERQTQELVVGQPVVFMKATAQISCFSDIEGASQIVDQIDPRPIWYQQTASVTERDGVLRGQIRYLEEGAVLGEGRPLRLRKGSHVAIL
jgi:hypothetical protein